MQLYLVRHGDAMTKSENPERPLTKLGKEQAAKVAAYLAKHDVCPVQIRHSEKARARETAKIIGAALKPEGGTVQVSGLKPNDETITLTRAPQTVPEYLETSEGERVVNFKAGETLAWSIQYN